MKLPINRTILAGILVLATSALAAFAWTVYPAMVQHQQDIEKCAEAKKELGDTTPGKIDVTFKPDVTEGNANSVLASYGLTAFNSYYSVFEKSYVLSVSVPEGHEYEWMCELEQNGGVKNAMLYEVFGAN